MSNVTENIHALIKIAVVCGIVLLCFWLFKHRARTSVEPGDKSMDASGFPEGGYSVDSSVTSLAAIKSGAFVAYRNPKDPTHVLIARVIGVEGARVEVTPTEVRVNGAPIDKRIQTSTWTIPETLVPRGCAYLLADDPLTGMDSKQIGPVPFSCILGTVTPSR